MAGSKGSKYYNIFLDYNVWLANKETKHTIINSELFKILELIGEEKSISQAAEKFGVSYRKAWGLIKEAEEELNLCLVKRQRGGEKGGKSELSDDGQNLINAYKELNIEISSAIYNITKKFFNTINI